jgi:hypothetical protein
MSDPALENPTVRYEESDFTARGVIASIVGLGIGIGAIAGVVAWLYWGLADWMPTAGAPAVEAPYPALDPDVQAWAEEQIRSSRERANSYGWVDRQANIVHIPVERAMDLLLQEGFPQQQNAAPAGEEGRFIAPIPSIPPVARREDE